MSGGVLTMVWTRSHASTRWACLGLPAVQQTSGVRGIGVAIAHTQSSTTIDTSSTLIRAR